MHYFCTDVLILIYFLRTEKNVEVIFVVFLWFWYFQDVHTVYFCKIALS